MESYDGPTLRREIQNDIINFNILVWKSSSLLIKHKNLPTEKLKNISFYVLMFAFFTKKAYNSRQCTQKIYHKSSITERLQITIMILFIKTIVNFYLT